MLSEAELVQVRDYVIKMLPELLRSEPAIATTIEGILAQHFPRRDEFARLLHELQEFRREPNARFDALHEFRSETNARFDALHEFRSETTQHFEQVDKRFEQVDRTLVAMKREMVQLKSGQESIIKRMDGIEGWFKYVTGSFRNDKGESLEEMVAAGLRYGLKHPQITASSIRLRQPLVDQQGLVFPAGFETEVDVVAENEQLLVFEVKATAKPSEVGLFALKVQLLARQNPNKEVQGIFITPEPSAQVVRQAQRYGVELLSEPRKLPLADIVLEGPSE